MTTIPKPKFSSRTPERSLRAVLSSRELHKVDDFDKSALWRIVYGFFPTKRTTDIEMLRASAIKALNFTYSVNYLRQTSLQLGFVYRRRRSNIAMLEHCDSEKKSGAR